MNQPIPGAGSTALTCPTCGGSLEYNGVSPTVLCKFCGNTIAVASQTVPRAQSAVPPMEEEDAFAENVRLLVELGDSDQAVELLCQKLSIPIADARNIVSLFAAGNYGNETQIIADVVRRKGGQARA